MMEPRESQDEARRKDLNAALMREIGSTKGSDPIPPDQYLTYMDGRYPPKMRLWAWVLSKTIRFRHRSAFCVNERKQAIRLEHAEADLNMDPGNVRRAWRELEEEGRVRREADRLRVIGDFELPAIGEEKAGEVCTDLFPQYILNKIKGLSLENQALLQAEYAREAAAEDRVAAGAVAAVRFIFDQRKYNTLLRFGIKKIREDKTTSKKPKPDATQEQLRLLLVDALVPAVPNFVQTFAAASVQTSKNGLYKGKNGFVQTSSNKEAEIKGKDRGAPPPPPGFSATTRLKTEEEDHPHSHPGQNGAAVATARTIPCYADFKEAYPHQKLDDGLAFRAFEKLSPSERLECMRGLARHLESERWVRSLLDNDGRYVPLASRFILQRGYRFDPPPYIPSRLDKQNESQARILDNLRGLWGGD